MTWFDIVKIQTANSMFSELANPKQKVAEVETSGDSCCETAREQLKDLILNSQGYLLTRTGAKLYGQDAANHIDGKDCQWLKSFIQRRYDTRNHSSVNPRNKEEIERIYNDWEECERA